MRTVGSRSSSVRFGDEPAVGLGSARGMAPRYRVVAGSATIRSASCLGCSSPVITSPNGHSCMVTNSSSAFRARLVGAEVTALPDACDHDTGEVGKQSFQVLPGVARNYGCKY